MKASLAARAVRMAGLHALAGLLLLAPRPASGAAADVPPHDRQVKQHRAGLEAPSAARRMRAAESLGYLRATGAADALARALRDEDAAVRRTAALSLGWCGGRPAVPPLLAALDDTDWTVRQAAWVALTNLTGQEWPLDALAPPDARAEQAERWRAWWRAVPPDRPPDEVLALLKDVAGGDGNWARGAAVKASSTYKGPPDVLTDGATHSGFWQTKNVPFPQHCTIDLGEPRDVRYVIVHQYGPGFCMTDYAVALSENGRDFREAVRRAGPTKPLLVVEFPAKRARYVRVISYKTERPLYPTTFREVEVPSRRPRPAARETADASPWRAERGLRALGALGGTGAADPVLAAVATFRTRRAGTGSELAMVQAGLRSLGRLRDPRALAALTGFLENPLLARFAADALGDLGDPRAIPALVAAYPRYAISMDDKKPALVPRDDKPGFECADRMYETPFAIAAALSRLAGTGPEPARGAPTDGRAKKTRTSWRGGTVLGVP